MSTTAARPAATTTDKVHSPNGAVSTSTQPKTKRKRLGHTAADPTDMAGTYWRITAT